MGQFLRQIFQFVRVNPGILFSLALIVLIPLTLYYNTFLAVRAFQKSSDSILQNQALMTENIMAEFFAQILDNPEEIQTKLSAVVKNNPQLQGLRVLKEGRGGSFSVIASQNPEEVGLASSEPPLALAFSQDQTIASLSIKETGERAWNVIKPLQNSQGEKVGLLTMELSLKETDEILAQTLLRSYFVMIAAIALSLILILHHTRLFEYVSLSKRLVELDKMKDDFIRMATHELQSPITNIRGYLEALGQEIQEKLSSDQKEMLWRINVSAKNLTELIEDILEVSRIEQGRLDITPQIINPVSIIEETAAELRNKAQEKGLSLEVKLPQNSYFIKVNAKRLRQILFNLINNALKYTKEGRIEISALADENKKRYLVWVKDTGVGISAEAQKRLFEKFYRVRTKDTASVPGTGLGLWISKQLTEKMGGQIFVESMEAVGTKLTLVFPLVKS